MSLVPANNRTQKNTSIHQKSAALFYVNRQKKVFFFLVHCLHARTTMHNKKLHGTYWFWFWYILWPQFWFILEGQLREKRDFRINNFSWYNHHLFGVEKKMMECERECESTGFWSTQVLCGERRLEEKKFYRVYDRHPLCKPDPSHKKPQLTLIGQERWTFFISSIQTRGSFHASSAILNIF